MAATTASEVIDSFESSFQDKCTIPEELELLWLSKAVGQYSVELDSIQYDSATHEFACELSRYAIDTLAQMMKVYYMEREVSKVNKRVSIVSKDISIDGRGTSHSAAKNELDYNAGKAANMVWNQKPPAYN